MAKMTKRMKVDFEKVDRDKRYSVEEAFGVIDSFTKAKFDETVEVAINLGVDPKKSDQMVRSSTPLPNGLGKTIKIAVFAKDDKAKEAQDAGADFVGAEDLVEKIQGGWFDFDKAVATPDMMSVVSKIGKILGPRGLMPNPKVGTVTKDVAKVIGELKAGKVEFRVEKGGIIHAPIGKRSFGKDKLMENYNTLVSAIRKAKPAAAKGTYIRAIAISSTMSPGVRIDTGIYR